MRKTFLAASLLICFALTPALQAGQAPGNQEIVFNHSTSIIPLPNGVAVEQDSTREEITALRDDVLRIRIGRNGTMPEDASWAVLPEPLHSHIAVTPESSEASFGFRTKSMQVQIARSDLKMTIRDLTGNVVQQDALPVQFDGDSFLITKIMPLDEHYFGLGDKTGPLDRREEALSLWNTDAYRFQESTDPIYKSIPFFITYKSGTAAGVFLDDTWRTSFDFGKQIPGIYSFGAVSGPLDYYVIYGPSPKQVVESYAWLTGTPPLPPLWTLGFQQSRYTYVPGLTPGTTYAVRLHFADLSWTAAGQRVFNVAINGTTVLRNFDIFATSGAQNRALTEEFTAVANSSGVIAIAFTQGTADNPEVNGIEVVP